ncbi:PREDICTED: flowering time control protein FPA-like isoform X2 [Tarenaya hassleriana]|uniref:flowering time control protein FPA-like isoform X2 n=1 Tax=Tarenaya hassleriana TaxID=28532 RepID=UPI0008FD30D0|nr:PREDICTED: flowering time control protein FPA-like isoform X2 [Tarenaya hassleriana]
MMRREEKGRGIGGGGGNPPSRHLWVGNLPQGISERALTDRFLRFGELESVAFQPNRSYAFLNFKHDEDAFAAIDALQGFPLTGNPLRIEFAKADKSSFASHFEDQFRRDEHRSTARESSFIQKDVRMRYESPDSYSKSKTSDRDAEPSEVLWIGFPATLRVDEATLRKAFFPFGEIEKVTVFPGRSYAFVEFRSLVAACKAKETLQGKLFGNPRVHICFAKSEPSSSSSGRGLPSGSLSPPYRSVHRLGSSEGYFQGRNYADPGDYMFDRKGTSRNDGNHAYENLRATHRMPHDHLHDFHGSSPRESDYTFRDGPQRLPSRSSVYEEPRGLPEDDYAYHESKRLKIGSVFSEKELPDYPLSGVERERRASFRASADLSPPDTFQRNFEDGQLRYKRMAERPLNHGERSSLQAQYVDFQTGALPFPSNVPERKRYTPELDRPSLKDWKWEGTIAKGGNPVCRARCFPVGEVMDMMLDADMVFYNEFMHYLEEKQRAAVSKLDNKTTLFLVPPSDFSQKVLKVPGKLSISGVILRLEYPGPGSGPVQQPGEMKDRTFLTYHAETLYPRISGAFPEFDNPGFNKIPSVGNPRISAPSTFLPSAAHSVQDAHLDPYIENRHEQPMHQHSGSGWPPRDLQASVASFRSSQPQASSSNENHTFQGQPLGSDPSQYPDTQASVSTSTQLSGLHPEQLAQLTSSLLGQQKQAGNPPNQPERYDVQSSHLTPELSASSQFIHSQQTPSIPNSIQREVKSISPGHQNLQGSNTQEEETEANPQKRLQATLQLAAALLQQIQQAKGT